MRRLLACTTGLVAPVRGDAFHHPFAFPRRLCAAVPTESDVLQAYRVLGVQATASLADVKKRYGALAKEHHPDVATTSSTSSTSRMTDINTAYNTVKQFYQSGRTLSSQNRPGGGPSASASSSSSSSSSARGASYYTTHDSTYQPWYEDMDPLMYELMWEEMRRQNEEEAYSYADNGYGRGGQWRPPRHNTAQGRSSAASHSSRQHGGGGVGDDRGGEQSQQQSGRSSAKSTTWPEEQVTAMVNMYQDGKSFEFIANALGKESAAVVLAEFNRWSADSHGSRRHRNSNHNSNSNSSKKRRRGGHSMPHNFYYAASPDDIPFEMYEMMEEEAFDDAAGVDGGNPFGYYTGDPEGYEPYYGTATPFYGTHQMSGGVPPFHQGGYGNSSGGGRTYNSARNAPYKPSRNHRNGGAHRNKRGNNFPGGSKHTQGGGGGKQPFNGDGGARASKK